MQYQSETNHEFVPPVIERIISGYILISTSAMLINDFDSLEKLGFIKDCVHTHITDMYIYKWKHPQV